MNAFVLAFSIDILSTTKFIGQCKFGIAYFHIFEHAYSEAKDIHHPLLLDLIEEQIVGCIIRRHLLHKDSQRQQSLI